MSTLTADRPITAYPAPPAAAASLSDMVGDTAMAPETGRMHGAEVIASAFHFGMLTIAVLGALLMTGEYGPSPVQADTVEEEGHRWSAGARSGMLSAGGALTPLASR